MSDYMDESEYKRLSGRTKEEFEADIEKATREERIIIERFVAHYEKEHGKKLTIEDNGCGNDGKYLPLWKVRKDADFMVSGLLIEVKTVKDRWESFRLKTHSMFSYVKKQSYMLLVYGWETDNPEFAIITPKRMKHWLKTKKIVKAPDWENKDVIRLNYGELNWKPLP